MKKSKWQRAKSTEAQYARDLRHVAHEIGRITSGFTDVLLNNRSGAVREALQRYAAILEPWATLRAASLVSAVDKQNKKTFVSHAREMSHLLANELREAPTGMRARQLMEEQVKLITSLPLEAAERVHRLVIQNTETQGRASEIAKEIARTGAVTEARATLIARTEVGRVASALTQARAEYVGSDGYIWRTVRDQDVRHSHKKMNGKFVSWDNPPTLDGLTGHAGAIPNCRCYAEPVLPKEIT